MPLKLSHEELQNWFYYDETSPSFLRWKVGVSNGRYLRIKPNDIAGSLAKNKVGPPYWIVKLNGISYKVHRIVWVLRNKHDLLGVEYVDHVDRNTLNNSESNLRLSSARGNSQNRGLPNTNKTGVIGVHYKEKKRLYVATWSDFGKVCVKYFSVRLLGLEGAFQQACEYRRQKIQELNEKGMEYTDNHGKT